MQSLIRNKGITRTTIIKNGDKDENEIKWKANYDGKNADLKVNVYKNCKPERIRLKLNNADLSKILGVRPVPIPIDERLRNDFLDVRETYDSSDSDTSSITNKFKELIEDRKINNGERERENKRNKISKSTLQDLIQLNALLDSYKSKRSSTSYKPEPYLFRVNVPPDNDNTSDYETDTTLTSIEPSKKELLSVSDMLFDPSFEINPPPESKSIRITRDNITPVFSSVITPLDFEQIASPISMSMPMPMKTITRQTTPLRRRIRSINRNRNRNRNKSINKSKKNTTVKKSTTSKKITSKSKSTKGKTTKKSYKTPSPKTYHVHLTNKSS
jgi:hypothetical protein